MSWEDLRRAAIEEAALGVLTDPEADDTARRDARAELEQGETNFDRLTPAEVDCYVDITGRAIGQPVTDQHALVHDLACSWQRVADERRIELDATTTPGLPAARCRRCSDLDDADLDVLRSAIAKDEAEEKILNEARLEISDGGK
jgi:hypothetical protein